MFNPVASSSPKNSAEAHSERWKFPKKICRSGSPTGPSSVNPTPPSKWQLPILPLASASNFPPLPSNPSPIRAKKASAENPPLPATPATTTPSPASKPQVNSNSGVKKFQSRDSLGSITNSPPLLSAKIRKVGTGSASSSIRATN